MIEYAMLGTSHLIQDSPKFGAPVNDAIRKLAITFVAEEHTCDTISVACFTAKRLHIPYLQIDLFPDEWCAHGIDWEMKARSQASCFREQDIRLSHADTLRENFWLDRIEKGLGRGRVLIICGYLHLDFLADKIRARGATLLERTAYPTDLASTMPTQIFDPDQLKEYLREHGGTVGR